MTNATTMQKSTHKIEGTPVAVAMFAASVCASEKAEAKRTFLKSKTAFSTHCTARYETRKAAARGFKYFAAAKSPNGNATPATSAKRPGRGTFRSGARKPKTVGSSRT